LGVVIRSWTALVEEIEKRRSNGERVVTTNGIFDILHVGHARYLKEARALGDLLVIGVNSDASTKRLKGPTRPYNSEDDRAELLAALGCVDYVTIFEQDTPIELLETLRPDVHAKGGDYNPDAMVETPTVRGHGGQVVVLPFAAGRSTTNLVDRITKTGP
jgi:D-beta-D-heptose 7-phosphate kinase/D-beta-D-heptose 1-phosphate adenosyltransferase